MSDDAHKIGAGGGTGIHGGGRRRKQGERGRMDKKAKITRGKKRRGGSRGRTKGAKRERENENVGSTVFCSR